MNSYKYDKKKLIETSRLLLRPITATDAKLLVAWKNLLTLESHEVFSSREKINIKQHQTWFKNRAKNRIDYIFCEKSRGTPIGTVHFKNINKALGIAEAGKIIGDSSFRKMGFAKEAFAVWLKYGFEFIDLNKIYIFTDINNVTNINLNLKLGFKFIKRKKNIELSKKNFVTMEISKKAICKLNKILNI